MDPNQEMPLVSTKHGNEEAISWVSVCPRGLWRVQQRQIHKSISNHDAGMHQCPRMGSICQVRIHLQTGTGADQCVVPDEGGQRCTQSLEAHSEDTAFTRCLSAVLQVPLSQWTTVRMGEGQCDITEACLERMNCGDKCEIQLSPLVYSEVNAESDQPFNVTVELGTFTPGKESWELSSEEKMDWVRSLKNRGTVWFRSGDMWGAADSYSRALKLLITLYGLIKVAKTQEQASEGIQSPSESLVPSAKEYNTIKAELHSNLSLCQIKLKQPERAKVSASKATELDPGGAKAWYRLGQACQMLNELEESKRAFKKLLEIQPDSSAAIKALKDVAIKEKETNKALAHRLSKMFS
ncbi:FK506-binding protein-like [Boleophthalmus pectinirostris]|uniref:FK506-binding protein-like n=1 Tax=Boleophthalmus pectinirostris TaxID=150288 RepID=UPI000A1C31C7|nr:FK506-binding protein-like [Boleophthalmus pectinirostris]